MNKRLLLSLLLPVLVLNFTQVKSQCPSAGFSIQNPICSGQTLNITNSSVGASSYSWDFCPGFFSSNGTLAFDTAFSLSFPGDITVTSENDTTIIFVCGKSNGNINRVIYGNGPGERPTSFEDLGNFGGILFNPSDIALYNQNGTWYGIVVDYGTYSIIRLRFGNSLKNSPDSVTVLLNSSNSNLTTPWSVKLASDSTGNIFGLVGNFTAGTMTLLDFGNSILNTPVPSSPIPVTGASFVLDLILAHSCGNWYAFIAGYNSGNVVRADFGAQLSNTPTFQTIITSGSPSDLALVQDSSHWKLMVANYSGHNIDRYDLGPDLGGNSPSFLGSNYFSGSNPKGLGLIREGGSQFLYALYTGSNQVQTIEYSHPCPVNRATSSDMNPSNIVFSDGGSLPVTLTIHDAFGNSSSITNQVNIDYAPNLNFTIENTCLGDTTRFIDLSTISSGFISSWHWDFGNGDTSNVQSPSYIYSDTGNYTVTLRASGSSGCESISSVIIRISPIPLASFSSNPGCSEAPIVFNDLSSVSSGSISSWAWDFGNSDSSTISNPTYVFNTGGNYIVTLTITSDGGCTSSDTQNILINHRPIAEYKATNTCVGQVVQFIDNSTVGNATITGYTWDFGDTNTDTIANPGHTYLGGVNNYTVTQIVFASNGCIDTVVQDIKVNNIPVAGFTFSPATVCQGNDVQFTDLSSVSGDTLSGWFWDFDDGTTDSSQSPVHQFATPGIKTVTLIAYSPSNCPSAASQQSITITASPVALFSSTDACLNSPTQFTDLSSTPTGTTIVSRHWTFENGDTSVQTNPSYTFSAAGIFPVRLTVTSNEGCTNTVNSNTIIHALPNAAFAVSNLCVNQVTSFTNLSTTDSLSYIAGYSWNFGDFGSGTSNTSNLPDPTHTYSSTSIFNVFLIATTNFSCSDTSLVQLRINASPTSNFTYSPTCYGDLMEFFNPGSSLDSAYIWRFGDSQTNQLKEPAHFYAFPGNYTVTLTVYAQGGCATTSSKQVSVSPIPSANFAQTPACIDAVFQFVDSSSVSSGSIISWNWLIDSAPLIDSIRNPVYTFTDTGTYSINLTVTSDIGCKHSVTKSIRAHPLPTANFSFNPQFGNPPLDVQFTDFSQGALLYSWDFGDGQAGSNLSAPSHVYQDTGLFVISQFVSSAFGCTDSNSKNIYVIKPILDVAITGDSSYISGNYFHIVSRIANLGTRQIDSVNIEARLADGTNFLENYVSLIPNGPAGIQWYTFHASFLISSSSKLDYYCVKVSEPNGQSDDIPSNNEKCFSRIKEMAVINPYPNPFTDNVIVRVILPYEDDLTLQLIDQLGKTLYEFSEDRVPKGLTEFNLNLSDLPDGLYSVLLRFRDERILKQVVKNSRIN